MSPDPELPSPPPALPLAETVALDQAGAAVTEPDDSRGPVHPHCENCGARLAGPYCHQCGQHDFDVHRSFRSLFLEAVDTLFNLEGRFFKSIVHLLFHPGRLTAEFNAGKRAAQMPPFRLYIFVSVVFFLVIFLDNEDDRFVRTSTDKPHQGVTVKGKPVVFDETKSEAEAAPAKPAGEPEPEPATPAKQPRLVDQIRAAAEEARGKADEKLVDHRKPQPVFLSDLETKLQQMNDPAYRQRISERFKDSMGHVLLFCLPCFALYTRVLFRKSGLMYLQHLVLSLHFHTFIYLWIVCRIGWAGLADLPGWGLGSWVAFACNVWLWLYPVLMLKRLFANSWPKTLFKTFILAIAYTLTISLGFMITAFAALMLT